MISKKHVQNVKTFCLFASQNVFFVRAVTATFSQKIFFNLP